MTEILLHGFWRSSAAYRVRIALALKGLAYRQQPLDLIAGEQHSDTYVGIAPHHLVPALEYDGRILIESPAILEWIDAKWPAPPLLPANIDEAAIVRGMAALIACDIHPLNNLRVLKYLTRDLGLNEQTKDRWIATWIAQGFEALEAMAGEGKYLGGDTPGIADCCLVPQMYNARRFEVPLDDYPRLVEIDALCMEHEAFQRAHPDAVKSV